MQLSGPNGRGLDHFPATDQGSVAGDRVPVLSTTREIRRSIPAPAGPRDRRRAAAETIQTQRIPVTLAERPHPFPSRTRKLSSPAPKILRGQPFGKIGRRRDFCVPAGGDRSARDSLNPHFAEPRSGGSPRVTTLEVQLNPPSASGPGHGATLGAGCPPPPLPRAPSRRPASGHRSRVPCPGSAPVPLRSRVAGGAPACRVTIAAAPWRRLRPWLPRS